MKNNNAQNSASQNPEINAVKKSVLSGLSVLLATFAVSPIAQAAEPISADSVSVHQLRTAEFDSRNKSFAIEDGFSAQSLRLAEMDSRNKNFDVKDGFSVQSLRLAELDSRNKVGDSLSTTSLMAQRQLVLERGNYK